MISKINNKKVLVEMSGGVDSAVTALLLKQQGYECFGCMMKLHECGNVTEEIAGAKKICKSLNIPFKLVDLTEYFNKYVIDYFCTTYLNAKTPNPCIMCNINLKFGQMFQIAKERNCEFIATGHYAKIEYDNGAYHLKKAKDLTKDQSYVLFFLSQEKLRRILLPLGNLTKDEVRKIAQDYSLPCAKKDESQDICFIPDGDYPAFISRQTGTTCENSCDLMSKTNNTIANKSGSDLCQKPGNIIDTKGNILGKHNGLINYTIGQRKGLGVALGHPAYVVDIDIDNNTVVLGDKQDVCSNTVYVKNFSWTSKNYHNFPMQCSAKLRYRQKDIECTAKDTKNGNVKLTFKNPVSAITPGQFAVLYKDDTVLGGGEIISKKEI